MEMEVRTKQNAKPPALSEPSTSKHDCVMGDVQGIQHAFRVGWEVMHSNTWECKI